MRYFPLFLDVASERVVLVGEGEKALQKLRLLVRTTARIRLVAARPSRDLADLAAAHGVEISTSPFVPADLDGARLVVSASDDPALDEAVATAAEARAIPINIVDRPQRSSFLVPAIVDRDPIIVAIGSEGTAPVLARRIRARLEALMPARLGAVARHAGSIRARIAAAVADSVLRRRIWERLITGPWYDHVLGRDEVGAERHLEAAIAEATGPDARQGSVALVGAGPGDPDLLTLRAQQRLQEADVIVVDGLVPDAVLDHARRDARIIRVAKEGWGHATPQADIDRTLVREAAKGHRVVRLKGGDPLIFGRAAEEIAAVRAAGFPVEIVPGITAALGAAASIQLPVTLRRKVRQFSIVTGATADGLADLDWRALARPGHAFAIYMGVAAAPAIAARLIAEGASPALAIVAVENATRPEERAIHTTLADLPAALHAHDITGPAVIFAGLDWSEAGLSPPRRMAPYETSRHAPTDDDVVPAAANLASPEDVARLTHWVAG
ncbi:MAG: siroheme synthase CysG [Hyphomicrobiaceae bacterium]